MASREYKSRPAPRRHEPEQPSSPLPTQRPEHGQQALDRADNAMSDIDEALNNNTPIITKPDENVYDEAGNSPSEAISPDTGPKDSHGSKQETQKSHSPDELNNAESNAEDDQSSDADQKESNAHGSGGNDFNYKHEKKRRRGIPLSVGKKRLLTISVVFGLLFGGGGGTFFILKGPLELLQLASLFDDMDWRTDHSVKSRLSRFASHNPIRCRLGSCDSIGETRVTFAGSRRFHNIRSQMEAAGVTFERRAIDDRPVAINIDSARNPEFQNPATTDAKRAAIADFYGVDVERVHITSAIEGRFRIDLDGLGIGGARSVMFSAIRPFASNRITVEMNKRVFANFFDLPSLFRPTQRVGAEVEQRYNSARARRDTETERRRTQASAVDEGMPSRYRTAIDDVRSNVSPGAVQNVNRALFVTDALCSLRAVAEAIPLVNYAAVVVPSVVAATDKQSWGSAIKSGNTSLGQVGAVVESFRKADGESIWAAKSLNSLVYRDRSRGRDIDSELKQSFTSYTTGNGVLDWIGESGATGLACNDIAQIVLTIGEGIITVVTVGGWTAAKVAGLAATTAASIAAIGFLQNYAIDFLSTDPVEEFAGAQGGNLLAYGARYGSNLNAIEMGGIALGATETRALELQHEEDLKREFRKKSLAARIFDPQEKRSLLASAVRSSNTDPGNVMTNLASGMMNSTKLMSNIFSAFTSKVSAQADEPYEWDFPIYGVPSQILEDETYANPYENAELVAEILEGDQGQQYIDKAESCFGVNIRRLPVEGGREVWSVLPSEQINPTEDTYTEADCGNVGTDQNWARVIVFVFDTSLITIIECYQGDQEACEIMIYGAPEEEGGSTGPPIAPGDCPDTELQLTEDNVGPIEAGIVDVAGLRSGSGVHGCIAEQVGRMFAAASNDGIQLGGGGFRSLATQIELRRAHCGTSDYAIYEMPSGNCTPPTATPGRSQHERGLAIDFTCGNTGGGTMRRSDPCFNWMEAHAESFGFFNLPSESWHWSTTGS